MITCKECGRRQPEDEFWFSWVTGEPGACSDCRDRLKRELDERREDRERRRTATEKVCRTCDKIKPLDEFARSASSVDGRRGECKGCRGEAAKLRRTKKLEAERQEAEASPPILGPDCPPATKRCNVDGAILPVSEFNKNATRRDGLQATCRAHHKVMTDSYRKSNRDELAKKRRGGPQTERRYMNYQRRRARLHGVPDEWIEEVWRLDVFRRDNWVCQLCNLPTSGKAGRGANDATVDHWVPLGVPWATHTMANCVTAHYSCNVKAKDGLPPSMIPVKNLITER